MGLGFGLGVVVIAEAIVATWREIDAALTPILGQRGVATLYKRCLYLTSAAHPWLAGTHEGMHATIDLAALHSAFSQQERGTAAGAAGALLHTFDGLLASLVGPSLTERLLRSVWANSLSGPAAQDATP